MNTSVSDMQLPTRVLAMLVQYGGWQAVIDHIAKQDQLRAHLLQLQYDFKGCGDHSRHKQAAEAWHYCADKIGALLATPSAP